MASKKAPPAGKFMVEVKQASTRIMARRFATMEEAKDFFVRTSEVHQQKANREGHAYQVKAVATKDARSSKVVEVLEERELLPKG